MFCDESVSSPDAHGMPLVCSEYNEGEHSRWDGFSHPVYPQTGPLRVRYSHNYCDMACGMAWHSMARSSNGPLLRPVWLLCSAAQDFTHADALLVLAAAKQLHSGKPVSPALRLTA